jgi:hypothetical protein
MSDNNSATAAHIDEQQLDVFLHRYFNLSLPVGSVSTILTEVFNALIAAGVVLFDDGTPGSDVQITVHGGRMVMTKPDPQTGQEVTTWWTPGGPRRAACPRSTGRSVNW